MPPPVANYFDVKKDFNAFGNGVDDDTTAISTAFSQLNQDLRRGTLFFPTGTYNVTSLLPAVPPGIKLLGAGWVESYSSLQGSAGAGSIIRTFGAGSPFGTLLYFQKVANSDQGGGLENIAVIDILGRCSEAVVKADRPGMNLLNCEVISANTVPALLMTGDSTPDGAANRSYITSGRFLNTGGGPAVRYINIYDTIMAAARIMSLAGTGAVNVIELISGGTGDQFVGCRISGNPGTAVLVLIRGQHSLWTGCLLDNPGGNQAVPVKIAPTASGEVADGTSFVGCLFRNFQNPNIGPAAVLVDTSAGFSANDLNFSGCRTVAPSKAFDAFIRMINGGTGPQPLGVIVAGLTGEGCSAFYDTTGLIPFKIASSLILSGTARYPSENAGSYSFTTPGPQSVFTIPHGLHAVPKYVNVIPSNQPASSARFYVSSVDATNITITYSTNLSGTLTWYFEASLVPGPGSS